MEAIAPWAVMYWSCSSADNFCHADALDDEFVVFDAAAVNGFGAEPPVAFDRSHWKDDFCACWDIIAFVSSELIGEPWRYAYIQSLLPPLRFIEPVLHLSQFSQRTLAVIFPLEIPEPSKSV